MRIRLGFILAVLFIQSCALLDTEEASVPGYIYVPSFRYYTDDTSSQSDGPYEGQNTQKFVDVWLSREGIALGTIGLPALIPVTGTTDSAIITIDAGIMKTGQSDERVPYAVIKPFKKKMKFTPGVVDTVIPEFRYLSNRKFAFIEDFDRTGMRFVINDLYKVAGDTILKVNDQRARTPGKNSGMLAFNQNSLRFQVRTERIAGLPGMNSPVFLELDYHTNLPLDIGYYYFEPGQPASGANSVIQLFPSTGWNKIYIALNLEIAPRKAGTEFIFYIGVYNPSAVLPEVFIDNAKLVYLE